MIRCVVTIVVALLILGVVGAYFWGGVPYAVYQTAGEIMTLGADERGVFWLEGKRGQPEAGGALYAMGRGDRQARCLFADSGLTVVAGTGEFIAGLQRVEESGRVLLIPRLGGTPKVLADDLSLPTGLAVGEGQVFWSETTLAAVPHAPHIPIAQAWSVIKSVPLVGGEARPVAYLSSEARGMQGELLGVQRGCLYMVHRIDEQNAPGWSVIRAIPLDGRTPESWATEQGLQTGLLREGWLYWTGASDEAAYPVYSRTVRRKSLSGEAASETLTDWLPPDGRLCWAGGHLYLGAMDGTWRVPEKLSPPVRLGKRGLFFGGLVAGYRGAVYQTSPATNGMILLRRPVTLWTRVWAGLIPGRGIRVTVGSSAVPASGISPSGGVAGGPEGASSSSASGPSPGARSRGRTGRVTGPVGEGGRTPAGGGGPNPARGALGSP
ncbi:MAG: hypothetical protein ACUVX8_13030 [Candidatus Zipacnadales bacterium]